MEKKLFEENEVNKNEVEYYLDRGVINYFMKINKKMYMLELSYGKMKWNVDSMTRSELLTWINKILKEDSDVTIVDENSNYNVMLYSYQNNSYHYASIPWIYQVGCTW